MENVNLTDLFANEIAQALNLKPFQGRQIFQWLHRKRVFDIQAMTNLSKALRDGLSERAQASQIEVVDTETSHRSSGTRKMLFRLKDGEMVESVLIRDRERVTFCLSTQVGCAIKCAFCATGMSGFTRNLSAGEIVEQALHLMASEDLGDMTPNIVYMGMGEPFRNYDATVKSIRLLMDPEGAHIGARKITVSTSGDVEGIRRFAQEDWQVRLSVSLHAANDTLRSRLVPLNRKYPLETLMAALRDYQITTGRQITFEWTLMDGVNDSPRDAQELIALIHEFKASVNLIPMNLVDGLNFAPPSPGKCGEFLAILEKNSIPVTLRKERGQDIDAACGQLRRRANTQASA